jgi:hypothetical protein
MPRLSSRRPQAAVPRPLPSYRPQVRSLEDRLPLGDAILGPLLGGSLVSSLVINNASGCASDVPVDSSVSHEGRGRTLFAAADGIDSTAESLRLRARSLSAVESVQATTLTPSEVEGSVLGGEWTETSVLPTVSGRPSGGDSASSQSGVEMISAGRSGASPMQVLPQFAVAVGQTPLDIAALPNGEVTPARLAPGNTSLLRQQFGQLPLSFEVNEGQTDSQVRFLAHGSGYSLFLTATEAVMTLSPPQAPVNANQVTNMPGERQAGWQSAPPAATPPAVVTMQVLGGNPAPKVVGRDELPGKVNYFLGDDPHKWRTNVATYAKVEYQDVYPGINLDYYGRLGQLEYDFVVAPGADPQGIHVVLSGANDLSLNDQGDLVIHAGGQDVVQHKPFVYQDVNGSRREVASSFVLLDTPNSESGTNDHLPLSTHQIGFGLGNYDSSRPLIIDPVLTYSTYLGGSLENGAYGIAVDTAGSAFVTGYTNSTDFPTANPFQPTKNGTFNNVNAFVTKFSTDGASLLYSTYVGGSGDGNYPEGDYGYSIAVDESGSAYITGLTFSIDFPTANPFQPTKGGSSANYNAFVTKLSADGASLVYSTYLGGSGGDSGNGIAVDPAGNPYITGGTRSTDFPTANAFQPSNKGANAFVTKLSADGGGLIYSTYLGGSNSDGGSGIAVDPTGDVYVTGGTWSTDFPTANAFQPTNRGFLNAFLAKFAADGASLVYSTYLGGSSYDGGSGMALDADGNVYLTGYTTSTNFPTANAFQPNLKGYTNAFVTKVSEDGASLVYSSYLGGSAYNGDFGKGIATNAAGNAYVIGSTASTDFPTANAFQPNLKGYSNAFVTKLSADGASLVYSSYLGGSGLDFGYDIAVDAAGNPYLTGITTSTDFPTANAFQPNIKGGSSAFVTKIDG